MSQRETDTPSRLAASSIWLLSVALMRMLMLAVSGMGKRNQFLVEVGLGLDGAGHIVVEFAEDIAAALVEVEDVGAGEVGRCE